VEKKVSYWYVCCVCKNSKGDATFIGFSSMINAPYFPISQVVNEIEKKFNSKNVVIVSFQEIPYETYEEHSRNSK